MTRRKLMEESSTEDQQASQLEVKNADKDVVEPQEKKAVDTVKPKPPVSREVLDTGDLVLPGDMIGTNEEFISGKNTFKHGGNIYSTATGMTNINQKSRAISVIPKTNVPPELEMGDVVIGQVNDLRSSLALVEIAAIEGKGEREIVNLQQAAVHISNVKDGYVKNITDELSPFDIIKAKVIDMRSMRLSTAGKDLGVIKAYCSKCNVDLIKTSGNGNKDHMLKCPVCGKMESRKVSTEYGSYTV
ncbi:MAG: exosome complex RNA-binding protein Csl4 [ANME-2 cluster archaeon]|nr:exosome complex RNA-binding protein Csl4 [ANME-2 cluster archaeon]